MTAVQSVCSYLYRRYLRTAPSLASAAGKRRQPAHICTATRRSSPEWMPPPETDELAAQLSSAAYNGRVVEIRRLLEADRNRATGHGLMCSAAAACAEGAVDMLLRYGADVNERCEDWDEERPAPHNGLNPLSATPLMLAAGRVDRGLVRLLLDSGADPILRDGCGCTAADHARAMLAMRLGDPTWEREGICVLQMIDKATVERLARRNRALRPLRLAVSVLVLLHAWHRRASERAYAPGGVGYDEVSEEFRGLQSSICNAAP